MNRFSSYWFCKYHYNFWKFWVEIQDPHLHFIEIYWFHSLFYSSISLFIKIVSCLVSCFILPFSYSISNDLCSLITGKNYLLNLKSLENYFFTVMKFSSFFHSSIYSLIHIIIFSSIVKSFFYSDFKFIHLCVHIFTHSYKKNKIPNLMNGGSINEIWE